LRGSCRGLGQRVLGLGHRVGELVLLVNLLRQRDRTRSTSEQAVCAMPHSPASFESEVHVPGEDGRAYTISPRAKVMGTGGFAEVRVAQCVATGCAVAAKIIQLRPVGKTDERTVLREVRIMQQACSLPHANILRVLDVHIAIDTDADITRNSPLGPAGTAYILLELCEGGELFDRLTEFGQIPETVAVGYMRGLLKAVQHLHARGVIHRDIKLENALVAEDGTVKLADFGLAAELAVDATGAPLNVNAMLRDIVGSQSYVAPEVLVRKLKGYAGPPVDAWSCGVCLFTVTAQLLKYQTTAQLLNIYVPLHGNSSTPKLQFNP